MFKGILGKCVCAVLAVLLVSTAVPFLAFAQDVSGAYEGTESNTGSYGAGEGSGSDAPSVPGEVADPIVFTVNFYDWDETTLLGSFEVESGETSPTPMPPSREGHAFVKWDKDISTISDNLSVYAVYKEMKTYNIAIQYVFTSGEIVEQAYLASVEEGASFAKTVPSPVVSGYEASQTSVEIALAAVTQDVLYTVTYSPSSGTPYQVVYWLEELEGQGYAIGGTESFRGAVNQTVSATAIPFAGYTAEETKQSGTISADGSLVLNFYYKRNTVALYFDSAGGSYTEPLTGLFGAAIDSSLINEPRRAGYDFSSWDTTIPATFPESDQTFIALWDEYPSAKITVVFWVEDEEAGGYRVASVDTSREYATGEQPDYEEFSPLYSGAEGFIGFPRNLGITSLALLEKYFPKNTARTVLANKDLVVKSDGSTTYNIYYDQATVQYVFTFPGTTTSSTSYKYDGKKVFLLINGTKYYSGEYVITAKYAEDIADRWPLPDQLGCDPDLTSEDLLPKGWSINNGSVYASCDEVVDGVEAHWLEYTQVADNLQSHLDLMVFSPTETLVSYSIDHYYQTLTGGTDLSVDYELARTVHYAKTSTGNLLVTPDKGFVYVQIPGCSWVESYGAVSVPSIDGMKYKAYHDRAVSSVIFMSDDATVERIDAIRYGDTISNHVDAGYVPESPAAQSDYNFAGWYSSPYFESTKKVDLASLTMPANNLVLYAKWEAPKYTVTFDLDGGSGRNTTQRITTGGYIAPYDEPVRSGYVFLGWKERGNKVLFKFSNPVVRDLDLIAVWTPDLKAENTVYYRLENTATNLAAPQTTGGLAVGSSQTATAKVINGYVPDSVSKSTTINSQSNAIIFNYKPFISGTYQVRYETVSGTTLAIAANKTTYNSYVTENHLAIKGYYPVVAQLSLQMSQNVAENLIVFKYIPYNYALYTINHYQQNLDWGYQLTSSEQFTAEINRSITVASQTYQGFTYNRAISNPAGTVSGDGTLVLNLYYDRYTYSINFTASQGGNLEGVSSYSGILGGTLFNRAVSIPAPVADEGYRFSGWSPELPSDSSTVNTNATYTAMFELADDAENIVATAPDSGAIASTTTATGTTVATTADGSPLEQIMHALNQLINGEIPLASFDGSHWSLVNLFVSVVSILAAIILLARSFRGSRDEKSVTPRAREQRRLSPLCITATVVGMLPLVLFILLEDMSLQVALVNEYTIIFLLVVALFAVLSLIEMLGNRRKALRSNSLYDEELMRSTRA